MRYIALFLGLVIGTSTLAATPAKVAGASNFARKVAGASSWDSLFKSVDGTLNPLVMKELRTLTNELPYPQMRMKNDRLMISNENGEHLTMVLFEKGGDVSFNGKRWEIQPLAATESEVRRIAEILGSNHASLWDYVVSPAYAGGLSMTMGVAAAAYTSAASWKAEACAKPNPSDELVKTCSLMAVSMEGADPGMEKFYPISLKCPAENGGTLELVSKNKAGRSTRLQVSYSNSTAQNVKLALANSETKFAFKEYINAGPDSNLDESTRQIVDKGKSQSEILLTKVCLAGKEDRARYAELLNSNSKIIVSSASNMDSTSSDRKSSSGL